MIMVAYDYIWFLESTKERKKNAKENGFLIFGFTMKNLKKKKINYYWFMYFKFIWFYIIEENKWNEFEEKGLEGCSVMPFLVHLEGKK